MGSLRRWGLAAAALAASAGIAPATSAAQSGQPLQAATTSGDSEIRETIPISRRLGAEPRVAISLGRRTPTLVEGDQLRALGEVQVTNTCVEPLPRCIGRRYSFSPRVRAWLVLARSRDAIGGSAATRISARESVQCGQRRPNRNHHCVLVMRKGGLTVPQPGQLPCQPDDCYLNLVVSSHHPDAQDGNRL